MSLKSTIKGYHRLMVNGVFFSQHTSVFEAAVERASAILQADPSLIVTVVPPIIEVRASTASVAVPPVTPVTSDGGVDLIDFLDSIDGEDQPGEVLRGLTLEASLAEFAALTKHGWLIRKLRDATGEWIGSGWRGYVLLFLWRNKGEIKVGT